MSTTNIPFNQRFGVGLPATPLDKEVPESARIGLINLLVSLYEKDYIDKWGTLVREGLRAAGRLRGEFRNESDSQICEEIVNRAEWYRLYNFCERVYRVLQGEKIVDDDGMHVGRGPLEEAREYYTDELNQLLAEEGLDYHFVDGQFFRRGRAQTQKAIQRVGTVLSQERFGPVRTHYLKALDFFNKRPEPDPENCVKEALCALEASTEVLFGKDAAKGFDNTLRSHQGNADEQIPPALVDGMIKLRAFRGNARGVAHAALQGGIVTIVEAELVLSLVASYITYLNDKFPEFWDIPF